MLELVEFVDIVVSACLVYVLILWLKDARARLALVGVALVGAADLLALGAGLTLTARLLEAAFFISAVVLLLVFQEDLRRSFERLAILVLRREPPAADDGIADTVARAVFAMAELRHGALIVLPGREPLDRHIEGGVVLNGIVSEPLLLSLFDPHSPGHDGAAIFDASRVQRFAAHLPLSSDFVQLGSRGTRHAAALGLSERCDAVSVVVSEERGTVSVAQRGTLRSMTGAAELAALLRDASMPPSAIARKPRLPWLVQAHSGQMLLASAVSLALWVLLVPGATVTKRTFTVPVEVHDLPAGYQLASVSPQQVKVTVSGVRRAMLFLKSRDLHVRLDAFQVQIGRRSFDIPLQSVRCPVDVEVKAVEPDRVDISVRPVTASRESNALPARATKPTGSRTRHRRAASVAMVRRYIRDSDLFTENAATGLL